MKVAVCFAGLPRFNNRLMLNWKTKIVDRYQAQVFVHTWYDTYSNLSALQSQLTPIIQPTMITAEHFRQFDTSIYTPDRIWPHRSTPKNVLSMWYSINQSFGMALDWSKSHGFEWDIMIRARWDWWFDHMDLVTRDAVTVPADPGLNGHWFTCQNQHHCAHNDQFGYGPPAYMQHYANTFNCVPELYLADGVDFCSELLLTANLLKQNIPIHFDNINFSFGL
jgi:hypothetical protein